MSNFYWYGSSGNWSDYTNHWSLNSGNSPENPASAIPTDADNVIIDENSGLDSDAETISLDVYPSDLYDITCISGHSYTIEVTTGSGLQVHGSAEFEAGIIFVNGGVAFQAVDLGHTLKSNGVQFTKNMSFNGDGGGWTLLDELTLISEEAGSYGTLYINNGTFDANDFDITCDSVEIGCDDTATVVNMGSGTWELTGNHDNSYPWYSDTVAYNVTINAETSTIKFTDATEVAKYFYGGGQTYYRLWLTGSGTGIFYINGGSTFTTFKCDTPPHTIKFYELLTTTVTNWEVSGTDGNPITIDSYTEEYVGDGNELVVNGDFDGDADGWTLGANWTYVDNHIVCGGESWSEALQNIGLIQWSYYIIKATITGTGLVSLWLGAEGNGTSLTAPIVFNGMMGVNGTDGKIYFANAQTPKFAGTVDNVSVQLAIPKATPEAAILYKLSGVVSCDYLDISNSNATGGATWYAGSHSADTTNNDGWLFEDAPGGTVVKDPLGCLIPFLR